MFRKTQALLMGRRKTNRIAAEKNSSDDCWCDSGSAYGDCCQPVLSGAQPALTAEALMRSRYTAYATGNSNYLLQTWHPTTRPLNLQLESKQRWLGLKIKHLSGGGEHDDFGTVTFVARFKLDSQGFALREVSEFQRLAGAWVYLRGELES